jgi:HAD superfamily hydrolase (TIGR01509 family)
MIDGVLFDFSGTLFRFEPGPDWPSVLTEEATRERLVTVVTAPTMSADHLPPDLVDAWHRRDLDPDMNRAAYLATLTSGDFGLTDDEVETVYLSLADPVAWSPYPDTADVLRRLHAAGVPVAVVSNIAWDVRNVFRHHGLAELVDEFVMSYVEGVAKPDPKIFRLACQRLGIPPERALMVGDSPENDGGAASVGCATVIVDPVPTGERPSALRRIVTEWLPNVES